MIKKIKLEEKKVLKIAIFFIVAILIAFFVFPKTSEPGAVKSGQTIVITYECAENKSITAEYSGKIVNLILSDGRSVVLDHAVAPEGADKYTNRYVSVVLTEKDNVASLSENNQETHKNCVDRSRPKN